MIWDLREDHKDIVVNTFWGVSGLPVATSTVTAIKATTITYEVWVTRKNAWQILVFSISWSSILQIRKQKHIKPKTRSQASFYGIYCRNLWTYEQTTRHFATWLTTASYFRMNHQIFYWFVWKGNEKLEALAFHAEIMCFWLVTLAVEARELTSKQ